MSKPASGHLYFALRERDCVLAAVMWGRDAQRLKFAIERRPAAARARPARRLRPRRQDAALRRLRRAGRRSAPRRSRSSSSSSGSPPRACSRREEAAAAAVSAPDRRRDVGERRRGPRHHPHGPAPAADADPDRRRGGAGPDRAGAARQRHGDGRARGRRRADRRARRRRGDRPHGVQPRARRAHDRALPGAGDQRGRPRGRSVARRISRPTRARRRRPPRPSCACPTAHALAEVLAKERRRLDRELRHVLARARRISIGWRCSFAAAHPGARIAKRRIDLDALMTRCAGGAAAARAGAARRARAARRQLEALSPLAVLDRGYAMVLRDGHVVRDAAEVARGDQLRVRLARGELDVVSGE